MLPPSGARSQFVKAFARTEKVLQEAVALLRDVVESKKESTETVNPREREESEKGEETERERDKQTEKRSPFRRRS